MKTLKNKRPWRYRQGRSGRRTAEVGLKALYDAIRFLVKQGPNFAKLLGTVQKGFEALLREPKGAAGKVAEVINTAIRTALGATIAGVAEFLGIGDLPTTIQSALKKVRDVALAPLRRVLEAIATPIKAVFNKVLGRKTVGPVVESKNGKARAWVEDSLTGFKVMVQYNPTVESHRSKFEADRQKAIDTGKKLEPVDKRIVAAAKTAMESQTQQVWAGAGGQQPGVATLERDIQESSKLQLQAVPPLQKVVEDIAANPPPQKPAKLALRRGWCEQQPCAKT